MRISDWSSDVCSSDLRRHIGGRIAAVDVEHRIAELLLHRLARIAAKELVVFVHRLRDHAEVKLLGLPRLAIHVERKAFRSEERRVGKECVSTCRSRWSPDHEKKKST